MCHNVTAFRKLYDRYPLAVYRYSISFLNEEICAEEMVQEVFLKVWMNKQGLDLYLSFGSYLFVITRNLIVNFVRKQIMTNN
ncbi:hypothetical protein KUV50_02080 [Membranicola marinus]|uniref:RNA polymerase sigma-70 region 2 domain-containing protein n=1 Tax=Membranihabitans marinus TaxID=1227546 RepID=A0A953HR81_9BACT|nr:hypothetical protein [Membranihabitans marinus]